MKPPPKLSPLQRAFMMGVRVGRRRTEANTQRRVDDLCERLESKTAELDDAKIEVQMELERLKANIDFDVIPSRH